MDNDIEFEYSEYYADEAHCDEVPIAPKIPALASCRTTGVYFTGIYIIIDDAFADNDYKNIKNDNII